MIGRCQNVRDRKYHLYGGRGIQISDRWRSNFSAFLADVGRRPTRHHSIDRINSDGNYEPGNVRWATATEQNRNRRTVRLRTIDDEPIGFNTVAHHLAMASSSLRFHFARAGVR
jgi:hypothetical protein